MRPYTELPGFEEVFLEGSYVLAVEARPGLIRFELEVVLTPRHSLYVAPGHESLECYRDGSVEFRRVTYLEWSEQGSPPAIDATGEIDYGHIEALAWDGSMFELDGGDWGTMRISAGHVQLTLTGETTP